MVGGNNLPPPLKMYYEIHVISKYFGHFSDDLFYFGVINTVHSEVLDVQSPVGLCCRATFLLRKPLFGVSSGRRRP